MHKKFYLPDFFYKVLKVSWLVLESPPLSAFPGAMKRKGKEQKVMRDVQ